MVTCLVPVLFTFYIQGVLKLKNNSGAKGLTGPLAYSHTQPTETKQNIVTKDRNHAQLPPLYSAAPKLNALTKIHKE